MLPASLRGRPGRAQRRWQVVEWHADLWGRLADRCIEEARDRIPADQDEAEDRLKILMERALIDCEYSFLAEAVHGLRMMAS